MARKNLLRKEKMLSLAISKAIKAVHKNMDKVVEEKNKVEARKYIVITSI